MRQLRHQEGPIRIEIAGDYVKGYPNNEFQEDVEFFREKFVKSYLEVHDKLKYFYGPYQASLSSNETIRPKSKTRLS